MEIVMNESGKTFQLWLHKKFSTWLGEQPPSTRHGDFATYLNISPSMLSGFLRGDRIPARRTIYAMAFVLGPEIYDVLGMKPPKAGIEEIARRWDELSDGVKLKIVELVKADQKR
jgi:transcriptional regulator with XRE-family HTH domain